MSHAADTAAPRIEVVMPAYRAAATIERALNALLRAGWTAEAIIVVDDGSDDATVSIAAAAGVRLIQPGKRQGPAGARNDGVRHTTAEIVLFVDSDVEVHPGVKAQLQAHFRDPALAALFGSYDDRPPTAGAVSQYMNLRHHTVHHQGPAEASTFWSGLGAVRRKVFHAAGGFDPAPTWHFIEDVELGARLRAAGYRIRLDPSVQGTHLKRWTLPGMIRTDARYRARPWFTLMRREGRVAGDLNADWRGKLSVLLVIAALVSLLVAPFAPVAALGALAMAAVGLVAANAVLFRVLYRRGGLRLALQGVPLHMLHVLCALAGLVWATVAARGAKPWRDKTPALPSHKAG